MPMRDIQYSVGRIVFLTLLCMSLGTLVIGFVSIYGIQSFRLEFDRLVEKDLPQATIATRLNAEISGLTSQVGLLTSARSEVALGTIRIQTGDQLEAIDRLKEQLRGFELRPGEYIEIDNALNKLTSNLGLLTNLSVRRLRSVAAFSALSEQAREITAVTNGKLQFVLWLQDLETANRLQEIDLLEMDFDQIQAETTDPQLQRLGGEMLDQRRRVLEIGTTIQGRLNHHIQLSSRLADTTRFMSSRLISGANERSTLILKQIRTNSYLILASFLVFATIGAFIYVYLDKHVVGRIQKLTQRINAYEGHSELGTDNQNEITRIEASFTNLTETIAERETRLVALNDAATEARRDAEKANRSKSTLLAAASHDLRQPVHAMGMLIGGIDRARLDRTSRETLDQLANLTQETAQLFNSILDLSKLEAGTFTATRGPVNITELYARVRQEIGQRAELAGATLVVTAPGQDIFVLGDDEALYRILSNLVINAVEYAGQGVIELNFEQGESEFIFMVSDNGPGLLQAPDGRPDSDTEHANSGYGLGLSISFALATAMKTKLKFDLPETGGTRFSLPLPIVISPEKSPDDHSEYRRKATSLNGLSVILLEDNSDVITATNEGLLRLGCQVTMCTSIEHAQEAIRNALTPFLLVTDMDLGRGHSASGLIADALEHTTLLSGVIVTTASPIKVSKIWREENKVQVLEKPFFIGRLASLIRYILLHG